MPPLNSKFPFPVILLLFKSSEPLSSFNSRDEDSKSTFEPNVMMPPSTIISVFASIAPDDTSNVPVPVNRREDVPPTPSSVPAIITFPCASTSWPSPISNTELELMVKSPPIIIKLLSIDTLPEVFIVTDSKAVGMEAITV